MDIKRNASKSTFEELSNDVDIMVDRLGGSDYIEPSPIVWKLRSILRSFPNLSVNNTKASLTRIEAGFWLAKNGIYGHSGCTGLPVRECCTEGCVRLNCPNKPKKVDDKNVSLKITFELKETADELCRSLNTLFEKYEATKGGRGQITKPYVFEVLGSFVKVPTRWYAVPKENNIEVFRKYGAYVFKDEYGDIIYDMVDCVTEEDSRVVDKLVIKEVTKYVDAPRTGPRYFVKLEFLSIDIEKNLEIIERALGVINQSYN